MLLWGGLGLGEKKGCTLMLLQKRLKKVKPILVKKTPEKKIGVSNVESASIENHFEEIHPKDEFELLRATTVSHV